MIVTLDTTSLHFAHETHVYDDVLLLPAHINSESYFKGNKHGCAISKGNTFNLVYFARTFLTMHLLFLEMFLSVDR